MCLQTALRAREQTTNLCVPECESTFLCVPWLIMKYYSSEWRCFLCLNCDEEEKNFSGDRVQPWGNIPIGVENMVCYYIIYYTTIEKVFWTSKWTTKCFLNCNHLWTASLTGLMKSIHQRSLPLLNIVVHVTSTLAIYLLKNYIRQLFCLV